MKQVTYKLGGQTHAGFLFDDSIVISAIDGNTVPSHLIEELNIEKEWRDLEKAILSKKKRNYEGDCSPRIKNYHIKRIMPNGAAKPYAVWDETNSTFLLKENGVLTFPSVTEADEYLREMGEKT